MQEAMERPSEWIFEEPEFPQSDHYLLIKKVLPSLPAAASAAAAAEEVERRKP